MPTHLVGREPQLAVVAPLLDDLVAGRGRLLLLAGEPGIGKTRFAEEVATRARDVGATVTWGAAWNGEGAPPLWVWAQVLRHLTGSDAALDQRADATPADSLAVRFAQLQAVADVLRDAAGRVPLVVVLDDLHWADDASLRVLAFAAGAVRDVPCLIVATYRAGELPRTDEAELARAGLTVAIGPLAPHDAAALLRSAVGADVAPGATDAIVARSGGNPLFVWELGQLMAQTGRLDLAPAAVPSAIASVMERRLARLAESDVARLRVAAVVGDPFSAALVSAVDGRPVGEVAASLEVAADHGLVTRGDGSYSFAHALLRDVVLDSIDAAHRADLHRRAAVAFSSRADVDPAFHAVIADHLSQAGPESARAATDHWTLAAGHALRVVAHREAADLFARAAASCEDAGRAATFTVEQGEALVMAGDLAGARACFLDAAAVARATNQPELFARAVLGVGTGPVAWEVPMGDVALADLVAEALALVPEESTRLRSMLLARLSVAAATPQTQALARERAEEAVALAEQLGDPALLGQALAALNDALAAPSHVMTRRENADTIVELAVAAGDRVLEILGYRFRVVADLELGDIAAVDRDVAAFARLADALRQPLVEWYVHLFRGMRSLLDGDLDRAEASCAEVARAAEATGSANARMMATTLALPIDLLRGRPVQLLDDILAVDPREWAVYAAGLAYTLLVRGDAAGARELLLLHSTDGLARLGEDGEVITTLFMFGWVAIALGELEAIELVHDRLAPFSGLWAVDGIGGVCWGPVDLELGRLAIALDRASEARSHLARARDAVERAAAPLFVLEVDALERSLGGRRGTPPPPATADVFRREGQFWTLTYRAHTIRLKDAKGLVDIARLLAAPGREIHVLDLGGVPSRDAGATDAGELLDARARAEYRRRLAELEDDVADAEACADLARAERAKAERDFLAAELASALGLGGRPRKAGDPVERARKAVSGRIRLTIGRIADEHPQLARHLDASIRTGTYCSYVPEVAVDWELGSS